MNFLIALLTLNALAQAKLYAKLYDKSLSYWSKYKNSLRGSLGGNSALRTVRVFRVKSMSVRH